MWNKGWRVQAVIIIVVVVLVNWENIIYGDLWKSKKDPLLFKSILVPLDADKLLLNSQADHMEIFEPGHVFYNVA